MRQTNLKCWLPAENERAAGNVPAAIRLVLLISDSIMFKNKTHEHWLVVLAWVAVAVSWGSSWYANRVTFSEGGFTPTTAVALRFLLAAAAAAGICIATRRAQRLTAHMLWVNIAAAVPMSLFYALLYVAEKSIPGGLAATIQTVAAIVMLGLGAVCGMEKLKFKSVAGTMCAIGGVGIVFQDKVQVSMDQVTGLLLMLGATVFYGCANIVLRKQRKGDDEFMAVTVMLSTTALLLTIYAFFDTERQANHVALGDLVQSHVLHLLAWKPLIALMYQAVFTTLGAFALYMYLSNRVSIAATTTLLFAEPLVAVTIDWFLEQPALWVVTYTVVTFVGALIVLASIVPVVRWRKEECQAVAYV